MRQFAVVYFIATIIVHFGATAYETVCYVKPNHLNEIIEDNIFPATNNTKVILMAGVHQVINTTKEGLWLENLHSYMLTGESIKIECKANFKLVFYYCEDVVLSEITFKSCALMFVCTNDVTITSVRVIDSEYKVKQCYNYCGFQTLNITNAAFFNSAVFIQLENCEKLNNLLPDRNIPELTSQLVIKHSTIEKVSRKPALFIWHARTVIIANNIISFKDNSNIKIFENNNVNSILHISKVYRAVLWNVTFSNNSSPTILSIQVVDPIRFVGH